MESAYVGKEKLGMDLDKMDRWINPGSLME